MSEEAIVAVQQRFPGFFFPFSLFIFTLELDLSQEMVARFVRARKSDVDQAIEMIENHLNWVRENPVPLKTMIENELSLLLLLSFFSSFHLKRRLIFCYSFF